MCTWQAAAAPSSEEVAYRNARTMIDRGERDQALATADAALRDAGSRETEWTCAWRVLRAELIAQSGKKPEARALLNRPLPGICATSEAAVRRLVTLAMLDAQQGNAASGEKRIAEALVLAKQRQPGVYPEVLFAAAFAGNPTDAESNLLKAIELAQRQKRPDVETKARAMLAWKLAKAGRFAEAVRHGEPALSRARHLGLRSTLPVIETNLAWALVELGDFEGAAALLRSSEAEAARYGLRPAQMTALLQLGNVAAGQRDLNEAVRRYEQALELSRITKDVTQATALANLASASLDLQRIDHARSFNAEATKLKKEQKDENGLLRSRTIDARIAIATGQVTQAETILRAVEAATKELPVKWEAQARLATVYSLTGRKREAEDQFRNAVQTAGTARRSIKEWELRLHFTGLVIDVFAAYLDFLISNGRGADALAATEAYRAQTLEEGLGIGTSMQPLDVGEIARQAKATILCYWLGPRQSYLWVVTPQGIDLHKLPPDTKLNADLDAYQRQVIGPRGTLALLASRGETLYQTLVAPAGPIPRNSRVIVIPDGKLHGVNFETLIVPGKTKHFWIEDVVLSTAGSLQLISYPERKTAAAAKMLLVGNPPLVDPAFPALRFAGQEITQVSSQFKSPTLLTGKKATPADYMSAKPGSFDYLHFVAHGVATREKPLDSAIILGTDASKNHRLLARQIVKTPLAARLVTISSCYGSGSRNYAGEGLVGLAWAFLRAGADQVIAALWAVNDKATPDLMAQMYTGIRAGQEPAVALRNAKLRLVRQEGSIYRMPRYWAPFVLYTGR